MTADQTPATDSERVEQIRARVEVAGVGPWETYDANEGMDRAYAPMWCVANDAFHNPPADEDVEWVGIDVYVGDRDVADFIAHARDDIPFLLAEVARLAALLAEQAATIERVAAVHVRRAWDYDRDPVTRFKNQQFLDQCDHCRVNWPCRTATALGSQPSGVRP